MTSGIRTLAFVICLASLSQGQELGLTLGRILSLERSSATEKLKLSGGTALQANYGLRLFEREKIAVFLEAHFLANGLREISSPNTQATRDVATIYVTPGIRVKFFPRSPIAPYVVAGGGYALYEQSFFRIDGDSNNASRFTHKGALMFGGGVDLPLWRFIGVRFEVRDFYSGNPSFNTSPFSGGQHNVVVGGGFVLRF